MIDDGGFSFSRHDWWLSVMIAAAIQLIVASERIFALPSFCTHGMLCVCVQMRSTHCILRRKRRAERASRAGGDYPQYRKLCIDFGQSTSSYSILHRVVVWPGP